MIRSGPAPHGESLPRSLGRRAPACEDITVTKHRIYSMPFAGVYPHYINKAEKKGRSKDEVDELILWLTGYTQEQLEAHLNDGTDCEAFFAQAPALNPNRSLITGMICGVKVQEMEEGTMREIRYLDKIIDELAKGRAMEKIKRS